VNDISLYYVIECIYSKNGQRLGVGEHMNFFLISLYCCLFCRYTLSCIANFMLECRFVIFLMFHSSSYYPELDFNYCFLIVDYYCLQTIAVIPVLPHGVLQFGSLLPVSLSQAFCHFKET